MADFHDLVIKQEGLKPLQTPFPITSKKMGNWTSMFDDTIKIKLDPKAKKAPKTEGFLYLQKQEDLKPAVVEQFRRYQARDPEITIDKAVRIFDQSNPDGKIKYLKQNGIDTDQKLRNLYEKKELEQEVKRQM
jgi:hypothetical protein